MEAGLAEGNPKKRNEASRPTEKKRGAGETPLSQTIRAEGIGRIAEVVNSVDPDAGRTVGGRKSANGASTHFRI